MASSIFMRAGFCHSPSSLRVYCEHQKLPESQTTRIGRREVILRSSEMAVLASIFNFRLDVRLQDNGSQKPDESSKEIGGTKPNYLGVQKNSQSLALCPATKNCISTAEDSTDLTHYAPPWNYNPEKGRGKTKPVSREEAMNELVEVIKSKRPEKFTPDIVEKTDNYIHVEYKSPILGFVDDVEFWFPPGKKSIVEYRSASRNGNFDFEINRKRIKALRLELEKKGWVSESSF